MERQKYSLRQVSVVLLNNVLSLEYYMNEIYNVYSDVNEAFPNWVSTLNKVIDWSIEESFKLGLSYKEAEKWGDELLFQDFKPIADEVVEKNKLAGGKIAFLALFLSFVLEKYMNIPVALGKEQVQELLSQLKEYLKINWQTNLDDGIINPELSNIHMSMAQDFSERWQQRVESLTSSAS